MGACTFTELVGMLPGHSHDAIDFAHTIFGGSARHVCSLVNFSLPSDATEHYELVFSAMSEFLSGSKYLENDYEQLVDQSCKNIARELEYATHSATAVYYSLFEHTNVIRDVRGMLLHTGGGRVPLCAP